MDFGEILNQWEKKKLTHKKPADAKKASLEALYDAYIPGDDEITEDIDSGHERARGGERRLKPEAVLDLHGLTAEEARSRVLDFLQDSARRGKQKVLIIHGKGYHSQGEPVLKKIVRQCLEQSPYAGRHGHPGRGDGGTGAVWVLLKK